MHNLYHDGLTQSPKIFWKCSNSRLKSKTGIEGLKDEQGVVINCDESKTAIFNSYFASVFADEDLSTVPQSAAPSDTSALVENLLVTETMVKQSLPS